MGHLDEESLVGHAAGTLGAEAALHAEEHLKGCGDCQRRLHQISSLILSKTQANLATPTERVLEGATPGSVDTAPIRGPSAAAGTRFGRYVLLERLGTGGMGEVYKAQDPELDRTVALKILRPGNLGNDEGQARLVREAQSMARLAHPNVVTVHDVGRAENKVFVAMELVDGESLGNWLRGDHPWNEVLELLLGAGNGLAAAHDAGVVHRDFKPDNVLVGKDGRARVLDFGLARQTSQKRDPSTQPEVPDVAMGSAEAVQLTRDGTIMGTPGYMAPEQIHGLPTDARSDQFSFCVAAWEALYGKRPFGGSTLKAHAEQISKGQLPPPPANSQVPGWVHKALARGLKPDPLERWPSMHALIHALTPKRRTNTRWFVAAVALLACAAGAAIFIAARSQKQLEVCGGTKDGLKGVWDESVKKSLAATFPAARGQNNPLWTATSAALDAYARSWVEVSEDTCARGRLQKTDSEQMYSDKTLCLEGLRRQLEAQVRALSGADEKGRANALRAARSLDPVAQCTDVLALASRHRDHAATHSPEEEALAGKMHDARAQYDLGQYAKCAEALSPELKPELPAWLLADGWLLAGRCALRAGQNAVAEKAFFDAAVYAETAGTADAAARAWARLAMVDVESGSRKDERARQLRLAAANAARTGHSPEIEAEVENGEGQLALANAMYAEAQDHFARARDLQTQALGERHPETAMTLNNLGNAQVKLSRYDDAEATYQRALAVHMETSGADHPNTASTMQNLAVILRLKGHLAEALSQVQQALAIRKASLGEDSPEVATSLQLLAKLYAALHQPEDALAAFKRALEIRSKAGPESVAVATVEDDLAHFYYRRRDYKEAQEHAERAVALFEKNLGPDTVRAAGTRELLGVVLSKTGNWERSKKELDKALADRVAALGEVHAEVASSYNGLGDLAFQQKKYAEAEALYRKALAIREKALGPDRPELANDWFGIGASLLGMKKIAEAVDALEKTVALRERASDGGKLAEARFELARALWETGPDARARALELCQKAKPDLDDKSAAELDQWVAAHFG
jgi:tetratricopeptide (TPR) repeat protein/tRNA A-37 threonylcarbamoyl transferase component Bud32